jgi:hypothetical protein
MMMRRLRNNMGEDKTLTAPAPRALASFIAGTTSSAFAAPTTNSSFPRVRPFNEAEDAQLIKNGNDRRCIP